MKNLTKTILIIAMATFLSGCGSKSSLFSSSNKLEDFSGNTMTGSYGGENYQLSITGTSFSLQVQSSFGTNMSEYGSINENGSNLEFNFNGYGSFGSKANGTINNDCISLKLQTSAVINLCK